MGTASRSNEKESTNPTLVNGTEALARRTEGRKVQLDESHEDGSNFSLLL